MRRTFPNLDLTPSPMIDVLDRLKAALADRYRIEHQLGRYAGRQHPVAG